MVLRLLSLKKKEKKGEFLAFFEMHSFFLELSLFLRLLTLDKLHSIFPLEAKGRGTFLKKCPLTCVKKTYGSLDSIGRKRLVMRNISRLLKDFESTFGAKPSKFIKCRSKKVFEEVSHI